jgi:solute carrier family 35 protein C2
MLGWFFFSAILSSYNKYVFGERHMNFPCPLLLTSVHFLVQWLFSTVACACFPEQLGSKRVAIMTWKEWAIISVPCGLVTAFDVGLSNLSLVRITLTFYTMVKSSTPIFVLGWAYIFKIERITLPLICVILFIASGEFLTVYGEVDFDRLGFFLCLNASILSGLRWTLVQSLLQTLNPPLESTILTMKLLAPSMFWSMLVLSAIVEKPWIKLSDAKEGDDGLLFVSMLGLAGGIFAISMILCEFYLILRASAIILMIGGVVKELTTIALGISVFGDKLNWINSIGVCIVFLGVLSYKVVFHFQKKELQTTGMESVPTEEQHDQEVIFAENDLFVDEDHEFFGTTEGGTGEKPSSTVKELELVKDRVS